MRARFLLPRTTVSPPEPVGGTIPAIIAASGVVFVGLLAWSRLSGNSLSPATWYLTRAAGLTLYVVLWATVTLGLGMTTQVIARLGMSKSVIYSLHGYLTGLAYGFLALHLISLAADPFAHYNLAEMLIPFRNPWREPWTGIGVIGAYLTVLIGGSFALRRFTGYRAWRTMHWLTFVLYLTALAHGIGSGSDTKTWWARLMYAATAGSIAWLMAVRVRHGRRRDTPLLKPIAAPFDRFAPKPRSAPQRAAAPPVTTPSPARPAPPLRHPIPVPAPAQMRAIPQAPVIRPRTDTAPLPNATVYLGTVGSADRQTARVERGDDLAHWRAEPRQAPEPPPVLSRPRRTTQIDFGNVR